jgi:putative Mg2+ transporter-C (MgtC) family protein
MSYGICVQLVVYGDKNGVRRELLSQQVGEVVVAFALSVLIELEREFRQESPGLRTHTLVGVGGALFVPVSKYGFSGVRSRGVVELDPSRITA